MIKKEVIIIGGGITGCSIAYHLAKMGLSNVAVLEKQYLTSGATGRCGAGFRHQWGTESNCLMAKYAIAKLMNLKEEVDFPRDLEIKLGGYLIVAFSPEMETQLKKNIALQNRLDIGTRWVTPDEIKGIAPLLSRDGLYGGAFYERDGHANPFLVTEAYARAAQRMGVEIFTYTEVHDIKIEGGTKTLLTNRGEFASPVVIDAAGAESARMAQMVGVSLPIYPYRHQILVTEPVEPALGPMVLSFENHLYCQQTPHGSFIMGLGDPNEPVSFNISSSRQFLHEMAQKATKLLPALGQVHVVRQWAGLYDMSPDSQPILDHLPGMEGFYVAAGFSGHGFMIAPLTGELVAQEILGTPSTLPMEMFRLERFAKENIVMETSVV